MKLTQYLNVKKTTFKCQSVLMEKTVNGDDVIVMELLNPIREVIGSQTVYTQDWGDLPMIATNVREVRFLPEDYPNANIFKTMDRQTHKKYHKITNLGGVLDVSRNGKVWLKDVSFAVISKRYKDSMREALVREFSKNL